MAFQVITDTVERAVEVGRVRVEFHGSSLVEGAATERAPSPTCPSFERRECSFGLWVIRAKLGSDRIERSCSSELAVRNPYPRGFVEER
jgi:hypothetical protein